jgi:CTP-dependent riboflavin kinase
MVCWVKYYPGQALPGSEERTFGLDYREISEALGKSVCAGTFNVGLIDDFDWGRPYIESENYLFWRCQVATEEMIERDEEGYAGWIILVRAEEQPANLVEILSPVHLRTALKKRNWPAFPIEIGIW